MAAPTAPGRRSARPEGRWRRGVRASVVALTVSALGVAATAVILHRADDQVQVAGAAYPGSRGADVSRSGARPGSIERAASLSGTAVEPDPDTASTPQGGVQPGQTFHAYSQPGQQFSLDPELLRELRRVQAARREAAAARLRAASAIDFRIASFNVLGASHTDHSNRRLHSGKRMALTVDLIRSSGVDVAGLQEFQTGQGRQFLGSMGGSWAAYPGPNGSSREVQNSIAWRTDAWSLVESHTLDIPYFHGKPMPMPYVLLADAETGRTVWFINVHNAADVHGPAQQYRDRAITLETDLIRRLNADGTPVVITGDFNDRGDAFCGIAGRAPMHAALGGNTDGGCHPPGAMDVDWIFGSGEIDFSGYQRWDQDAVDRASDHPLLFADATVPGVS